ncbi:MAG: DUF3999 family protein [Alcanivoracaceae bacterium]|nr:DUF3999 family protein [Alcanivoracaceae bacterium]
MKPVISLLLVMFVSLSVCAGKGKFEKQLQLELSAESSGYIFTVPDDVYKHSYSPVLADLRIINATGDFVPMRVYFLDNQVIDQSQQWNKVKALSSKSNNELLLDTGGVYPVESFKIVFNQKNVLTDVKFYSRQKHKGRWQFAGLRTLYSITTNGINTKQDVAKVRRSHHRYWKVSLGDNIDMQSISTIQFSWRSHQLEFLAQGEEPFTLVYAYQGKIKPAAASWYNKIPSALKEQIFSKHIKVNAASSKYVLVNNDTVTGANDISKWIFWLILVIVIMILIAMAYQLLNE